MITAEYIYCDERGKPRLMKQRTHDKRFFMQAARYKDGRLSWKSGRGCIEQYQPEFAPRAMYHLRVLMDALRAHEPVFLVEGERDADVLLALKKLPATTSWQGASVFTEEQAEWFRCYRSRSVINIVRDSDPAGAYAAWLRYSTLLDVGVKPKQIRLYRPGNYKDVTDALNSRTWPALVREMPSAVDEAASTDEAQRAARGYLSQPTDEASAS